MKLIEWLVVIAIIAVIVSVGFLAFGPAHQDFIAMINRPAKIKDVFLGALLVRFIFWK